MLTSAQSRAARGLLGWTLEDLAKASGISRASLNNFEVGSGNPKSDTILTIQAAFERAGIEFIENYGVNKRGEKVDIRRWDGDTVIEHLMDDIFKTCALQGGEALFQGHDEQTFECIWPDVSIVKAHIKRMRQHGIKERVIYKDADRHFTFPPDITTYRWIDADLFGLVPTITYGNKTAIVVFGSPPCIIVTENSRVAESYRKQFEIFWSFAKPVPFTQEEIAAICQKNLPLDD